MAEPNNELHDVIGALRKLIENAVQPYIEREYRRGMADLEALARIEAKRRLVAAGCNCDVHLEVVEEDDHFNVSSFHDDTCRLTLMKSGVVWRAN